MTMVSLALVFVAATAGASSPYITGADGVVPVVGGAVGAAVGAGTRVSVGPDGAPWIVMADGRLVTRRGDAMVDVLCCARDVGVGADGTVVVIKDTGEIARQSDADWVPIAGRANRVDVGPDGTVWVVNDAGAVFRTEQGAFRQIGAVAADVGIGADGSVFIVTRGEGSGLWRFNGFNWTQIPGAGGIAVDVDDAGRPWVVGLDGKVSSPDGAIASGTATDVGVGGSGPILSTSPLRPGAIVGLRQPQARRFLRLNATTGVADGSPEVDALPDWWTWERFLVIDGGDGQIALFNTTLRRFLRLNDRGVVDLSNESPRGLPGDWAWERFVAVDGGEGQVALFSRAHGRFVRLSPTGATDSVVGDVATVPADPGVRFAVVPTVAATAPPAAAAATAPAAGAATTTPVGVSTTAPVEPAPPAPPPAPLTRYRGDFVVVGEVLRLQLELSPELQFQFPHTQLRGEAFSRHLYESDDVGVGFYAGWEQIGLLSLLSFTSAVVGFPVGALFTGNLGNTVGTLFSLDGGLNLRVGALFIAAGGFAGVGSLPTDDVPSTRVLQGLQGMFGGTGLVGYGIDNDTFVAFKLRAGPLTYDGSDFIGLRVVPEVMFWRALDLPLNVFNPGVFASANLMYFDDDDTLQRTYANANVGITF